MTIARLSFAKDASDRIKFIKKFVLKNSYFCAIFGASNHLYPQGGYGNFGFRAAAVNIGRQRAQYSDRQLYAQLDIAIPSDSYASSSKLLSNITFELVQSLVMQKAGHSLEECEDIWAYAQKGQGVAIALADGATESSFAQEWAGILVDNFVQDLPADEQLTVWLQNLQRQWRAWLDGQELSWFAKRKAEAGAFATLICLWACPQGWRVTAVGDSCLFVVRDRQLLLSFPKKSSQDFNHRPALIGTHTPPEFLRISRMQGSLQVGDRFYLTTDAIACWILRQIEANQDPWVKLEQISSQPLWADWVNELRDRREIANDDTTLLCLIARSSL